MSPMFGWLWFTTSLHISVGRLIHSGDTTEALFIVKEKESIMVEYDARAKTLAFAKNDEPFRKAFEGVGKEGEELYPMVVFDRRTSSRVRMGCGAGVMSGRDAVPSSLSLPPSLPSLRSLSPALSLLAPSLPVSLISR